MSTWPGSGRPALVASAAVQGLGRASRAAAEDVWRAWVELADEPAPEGQVDPLRHGLFGRLVEDRATPDGSPDGHPDEAVPGSVRVAPPTVVATVPIKVGDRSWW